MLDFVRSIGRPGLQTDILIVVFALLLFFFRNLTLVWAPMIVAMVSVICTMALLVITGNTVHIMSSMIPIFIMPIAVLDSVHILSEFFDFYPRIRDLRLTMNHVMRELFIPMFFTSVTTAVGFASLALVPIPPVQVFGAFVRADTTATTTTPVHCAGSGD